MPKHTSLTPSVLMAPAVSELPPRLLRTVISAAAPAARLAAPRLIPSLRGIDDAVATSSSSLPCLQQCDNATRALWLRHRTRQRHGLGRAHRAFSHAAGHRRGGPVVVRATASHGIRSERRRHHPAYGNGRPDAERPVAERTRTPGHSRLLP